MPRLTSETFCRVEVPPRAQVAHPRGSENCPEGASHISCLMAMLSSQVTMFSPDGGGGGESKPPVS